MKVLRWAVFLFAAATGAAGDTAAAVADFRPPARRTTLTNDGLVALAMAGFSEEFLLRKLATGPSQLDLSVEGLTYLRQEGLSEELITKILEITAKPPAPAAPASSGATAMPARPFAVQLYYKRKWWLWKTWYTLVPLGSAAGAGGSQLLTDGTTTFRAQPLSPVRLP